MVPPSTPGCSEPIGTPGGEHAERPHGHRRRDTHHHGAHGRCGEGADSEPKAQFAEDTKETKYFSLLPPDAKPPLDLNREMMEKFRPEMRKFYLNKPVQFR